MAYTKPPCHHPAVVTGLAVVAMASCAVTGLVLGIVTGVVVIVHVDAAGSPEEQLRATDPL
jgi:hypothetical protein